MCASFCRAHFASTLVILHGFFYHFITGGITLLFQEEVARGVILFLAATLLLSVKLLSADIYLNRRYWCCRHDRGCAQFQG